jgi:hypothetical protein
MDYTRLQRYSDEILNDAYERITEYVVDDITEFDSIEDFDAQATWHAGKALQYQKTRFAVSRFLAAAYYLRMCFESNDSYLDKLFELAPRLWH